MIKFSDFLSESKSLSNVNYIPGDNYSISFEYKGEKIKTPESKIFRNVFKNVIDWLYKNGYTFDEKIIGRKLFKKDSVPSNYQGKGIYYIPNSEYAILCNQPAPQSIKYVIIMLTRFGVDSSSINIITPEVESDSNPEIQDTPSEETDRVIRPIEFIKNPEKPKTYEKSPFGCKQEDGEETSALCILGKSGSGKTTTTEQALDVMGHEYLLYIPIEGEYTFSQYTGEGFEMSSLGEFVMRAQNDSSICYTVIFDECHRPITISKLNTDLLQALSSRRNRGGERFFTMDRVTKRMYTTPTEEFPIPLKEKSGKILVPDNFGIVCLSSQPAVICRNEDFLNRVDLSVFQKSDRGLTDITLLEKIDKSKIKGTELTSTINALLANEGE